MVFTSRHLVEQYGKTKALFILSLYPTNFQQKWQLFPIQKWIDHFLWYIRSFINVSEYLSLWILNKYLKRFELKSSSFRQNLFTEEKCTISISEAQDNISLHTSTPKYSESIQTKLFEVFGRYLVRGNTWVATDISNSFFRWTRKYFSSVIVRFQRQQTS